MIHENKKLAKITEELSMFFFSIGGDDQLIRIKLRDGGAEIFFESNYKAEYSHKLESMDRLIHSERDDGVEDIFWELAGSGDPGESSQLLLVGMMIDKADVEILPEKVKLHLFKKFA